VACAERRDAGRLAGRLYDDALMVAGTPDCVALLPDGRHWIIDFKTSNNCPKPRTGRRCQVRDMWESKPRCP
jgi:hypothetical protein